MFTKELWINILPKNLIRENNLQSAYKEVLELIQHLEDINLLYFKPMRLQEEQNGFRKAMQYIGKVQARLNKRIEISRALNGEHKDKTK
jgi:hypothetical protein